MNRYKAKSAKEKVHKVKSSVLLPVESLRTHLISPAMSCDMCEKLFTRESQRLNVQGLLGAGHTGILCLGHNKIPDSRRKASVQHKSCCFYKQFRHSESFISSGNGGNLPEIQVFRCHSRTKPTSRPLRNSSFSSTLLTLFCRDLA